MSKPKPLPGRPPRSTTHPLAKPVELVVPTDLIATLIEKAREFQAKVEVVEPDPGSNPSDGDMREVLEDYGDDPVHEKLHERLADLVAMVWLGHGDFTVSDWHEKRAEALRLDFRRTPDYLIETSLLADYLEEGMAALGR